MRKFLIPVLACYLAAALAGCSHTKTPLPGALAVDLPAAAGGVTISGEAFTLTSRWSDPVLEPAPATAWSHTGRTTGTLVLAGAPGSLTTDSYSSGGLSLLREFWTGDSGRETAMRLTLTNGGGGDIRLIKLTPMNCDSTGLTFTNAGFGGWKLFTQERLKNGKPSVFLPDSSLKLDSDPLLLIDGGAGAKLIIGLVSQDYHLAGIRLASRGGQAPALQSLTVESDFDGVVVPPGGSRASQWCYITHGDDGYGLIQQFAERMASYRNLPEPPPNAPSVFCSWYYWGPWFSESDLEKQLEHMGRQRVPFDVFLIDDCWSWHWGDWFPNDKWENGMKHAAAAIHKAGYRAGVWTCPTLANSESAIAAEHPEWLLRTADGKLLEFEMDGTNYVLDPTYPGVLDHIRATYGRITGDWGYDYLKLDFMRSVFVNPDVRFHDPRVTRLEAYRMALEAVREGAGPDTYISACGGHFGASLGLAESQRSGSDVVGFWRDIVPFRQNVLRTWMSRMWHVDADAMMVRREEEARQEEGHGILNVGRLSDIEARTVALNQYLCGDMVTFCEDFRRLDPDRRELYKHVIPSINSAAVPLDLLSLPIPSRFLTRVQPVAGGLKSWHTMTVVNWTDEPAGVSAVLDGKVIEGLDSNQYLVTDFFSQQVLGVFSAGAEIPLGTLEPHASALLRIAPWDGESPVLAGTDLHFSGGGVEIGSWNADGKSVSGTLNTGWDYPVAISVAFPVENGYETRSVTLQPGEKAFSLEL